MKQESREIKIMDYLDYGQSAGMDEELLNTAEELKSCAKNLEKLPLATVPEQVSNDFKAWLEKTQNSTSSKNRRLKIYSRWFMYAAAVASIVLLVWLMQTTSIEQQYQSLNSNPDKLTFIYNLNHQNLSSENIAWLTQQLELEVNPNVRITMIDVLSHYPESLDSNFMKLIQEETVPSVQMCWLDVIGQLKLPDKKEVLLTFSGREDLESIVLNKAKTILITPMN